MRKQCLSMLAAALPPARVPGGAQTAVMAAADLFRAFGSEALPFVDFGGASRPANSLLAALLLKAASNDKRFVIEAAGAAMGALCARMEPVLLVVRLLPYSIHKNPKARPKPPAFQGTPSAASAPGSDVATCRHAGASTCGPPLLLR